MVDNYELKEEYVPVKEKVMMHLKHTKEERIPGSQLAKLCNTTFTSVKNAIRELRVEYPICSTDTAGGGYWIADNEDDVLDFIEMISRRRDTYNKTLDVMTAHLGELE